jgi:phosphomannomutase
MSVFKAYDIRGLVPQELDETLVYKIGRALADYLSARRAVVGHDMRASSVPLRAALTRGLREGGCSVTHIGLCTTPISYFADVVGGYDGSVMITASHNPAQYNGLKMCREMAIPLSGDTGIATLETMVAAGEGKAGGSEGGLDERDMTEEYVNHLLTFVVPGRRLKVAVDCGNGMGGLLSPRLLPRLNLDVEPMYWELDGTFPNHEANPLHEENTRELQARVRQIGADLGVAFDGDADRVMFIDERGERVAADLVTALVARSLLAQQPGARILYDLRSSRIVPETVRAAGGVPVRCRVGHAFIKQQMRHEGAAFAGELSGHYYFRDNHFVDCGFFALIQVLNLLASAEVGLSELIQPLRRYVASGEINSRVADPRRVLEVLAGRYADGRQSRLDGLSVDYPQWWFNVRMSNTEPLVRLNLEAPTEAEMARHRDEILGVIRG